MTKWAGRDLVLGIAAPNIAGTLTSSAATDIFTNTGTNGFVAGDAVFFTNLVGGAGLVNGKRYYVLSGSLTATTFTVSLTPGGSIFDHTTNVTSGNVAKFNLVGQVTTLDTAGSTRALIDASAYGDVFKDYVVGQQDGDEISVEVALDNASTGHQAVLTAYGAGLPIRFGMTHTAAAFDIAFPAYITRWSRGGDLGGVMKGVGTLKIVNPGVTDTP